MTDHFSPIGFLIASEDDLTQVIKQAMAEAKEIIPVKKGSYIRWSSDCGAELWLQGDRKDRLIGMAPHFAGTSQIQIGLAARAKRSYDNALEGGFKAWTDPSEGSRNGAYPLVFDAPDFAVYSEIKLPSLATVQISAFAEEITLYESAEAFLSSQSAKHKLASQSFVPVGLFAETERNEEPSDARARFAGHVLQAEEKVNALSREPFVWALVETVGGIYDVVIARAMLDDLPAEGTVVSGSFWLSGRLHQYERREPSGLLERFFGRG
jgi:hypothetical protein